MLTRVRSSRPGKPLETTSVAEQAKVAPVDASSVHGSASARSRHAGSSTKRAVAEGLSAPFPRGAATPARGSASPEQSEPGGNARVFVLSKTKQPLMPCSPARGGSNRISNLTLACGLCNQKKGALSLELFLKKKPDLLKQIRAQARAPRSDAAAVNTTRWALVNALKTTGLLVHTASGGRTKWNRSRLGIPKTHALDALCVGEVVAVGDWRIPTLEIGCKGRGAYQRTRVDKYGFPRGYLMRQKKVQGFQTGDRVRAVVPSGKKRGRYTGRVAVRASGAFNIQTASQVVQGISYRRCVLVSPADGYAYSQARLLPALKDRVSATELG
jgi:hypothetical protein